LKLAAVPGELLPTRTVKRPVTKTVYVPGVKHVETRSVSHKGGLLNYGDDSGRPPLNLPPGRYSVNLVFYGPRIAKQITVVEDVEVPALEAVDTVRADSPAVDPVAWAELRRWTCSAAPLVDHRYFKARALTSIPERGAYKDIWGGLYYRLRGIRTAKEAGVKGATDLDVFFQDLGVGNVQGK